MAYQFISGTGFSPMCGLGWKSLGVLELTALPSIKEEHWVPVVEEADALLVWGGDVMYLCHWMRKSGLADVLPSLHETVWVGVSSGSMVLTPNFGEPTTTGSVASLRPVIYPPPTTERWGWSTSRCFRTWITRDPRRTRWPTQKSGPPGERRRRTRSTIKPPSR